MKTTLRRTRKVQHFVSQRYAGSDLSSPRMPNQPRHCFSRPGRRPCGCSLASEELCQLSIIIIIKDAATCIAASQKTKRNVTFSSRRKEGKDNKKKRLNQEKKGVNRTDRSIELTSRSTSLITPPSAWLLSEHALAKIVLGRLKGLQRQGPPAIVARSGDHGCCRRV